jgi:hypothetical protein
MSSRLEVFSVTEKRTGRKICECANEQDAIMLVEFDKQNRSYSRDRFILDQIIDVTSTANKQLSGQQGLPTEKVNVLESKKNRLPEGEGIPVNIY